MGNRGVFPLCPGPPLLGRRHGNHHHHHPTPTTTAPTASAATEPIAEPTPGGGRTEEDLGLWEKIELTADELEDSLERLVHEGTARRITVKKDGEVIADFPLAVGVVGTVLAAPLAAVAAIVALIAGLHHRSRSGAPRRRVVRGIHGHG